jgi:hypothetical protein
LPGYTHREYFVRVTSVLRGPEFDIPRGYAILGIERIAISATSFDAIAKRLGESLTSRGHGFVVHQDAVDLFYLIQILDARMDDFDRREP